MKTGIIEHLGHRDVLLPGLIAEALRANDRAKVRLSVLQAAARHAAAPDASRSPLTQECRTVGLDPVAMEELVASAVADTAGEVSGPGLAALGEAIWGDVEAMAQGVAAADPGAAEPAQARLLALREAHALGRTDSIAAGEVARLTGLPGETGDSLHRLIMDLHRALNRLAVAHAEEDVAGARVSGLTTGDRPLVEAFMRGLNATRGLKFDHPGLGTHAARSGEHLTIQNDIGETDAHVVVITVEPEAVSVTYTDVHLRRARFFTGLLSDVPLAWSGLDRKTAEGLADEGVFYLVTGRCESPDAAIREAVLEAIGANLVFLIDWNKARKVLRTAIPKEEAVRVLEWAARHRCGQRAFLELGGGELLAAAVQHAAPARIGFGERLDGVLGRDGAVDFLKSVLRICAETLKEGSSARLARDRIEAELMRHLERIEATLFAIVVRQAGLAREVAAEVAAALVAERSGVGFDHTALAAAARRREEKADRLALDARQKAARFEAAPAIQRLSDHMEEAVDELEQAAFIASLLPANVPSDILAPLSQLCAAAVRGAEAAASGAAAAAAVPAGQRIDAEDALASADLLADLEHIGDAEERTVTGRVLRGGADLTVALCALDLARALERATDRLAGYGHALRGHVLAELAL